MKQVRLIHWKAEESEERAQKVCAAGFACDATPFGPQYGPEMRKDPPDIYLIDLSRLPSHGREAGVYLRSSKGHGHVPVVFVDGDPAKVEKVRAALPDAIYCTWRGIKGALQKASKQKLARKQAPKSKSGAYSSNPLWKKLGLKDGGTIALSGAPQGFVADSLADLPKACRVRERAAGSVDILVWFVHSEKELLQGLKSKRRFADNGGLWVAWPKKDSEVETDLSRDLIRKHLLADGLVDIKVCAVNSIWSGMRYAFRQS